MKIIEALKRIKMLKKRMESNIQDIQKYSSGVSTERGYFESDEETTRVLQQLEQSTWDLWHEKIKLEQAIAITNIMTKIMVNGKEYTLHELLQLKRQDGSTLTHMYGAMNEQAGQQRLRAAVQLATSDTAPVHVVRFYDEKAKNEKLRALQDLIHEADSRLEVVNATSQIVDIDTAILHLTEVTNLFTVDEM